ncbi:tetratricopeptide repeat-containing sensor histidine kinase [Sphingobacterium sp. UBA7249]|uniref:tetratricopeptide repeat-containing sensor histidine kinase n=1 Tax=Sphingobacterium sp. UBA7249 TaxID=1947516 RepID=UPI0025D0189B|nr:ATP-binding protein [Sphingobacterium sp. UBA7249]
MILNKPLFIYMALMMMLSQSSVFARDTTAVLNFIDRAKEMQRIGKTDSAEYYFNQANRLSKLINYDTGRLVALGNYSVFLYEQLRYSEALSFAKQSLGLSLKMKNKARAAAAYNNISLQYQAMGKLENAAENLVKGLEISSGIKHPSHRDLSDRRKYYNNLSSLMLDLNDVKKGLEYAWESHKLAQKLNDTLAMGRSLVNIVVAEAMSKDFDSAERHAIRLMEIALKHGDIQMEIKAHNNLGDIYRMQKKYNKSLQSFRKAGALLSNEFPGNEVYVLSGMSSVNKDMGNFALAESYYHRAIELGKEQLPKSQLLELYLSGSEIKEGIGKFREALELLKMYRSLADSLKDRETHRSIQELELKYRSMENRKIIAERDLVIAKQNTVIERKSKWVTISISIAVLLSWGLIFMRLVGIQKRKRLKLNYERHLLEAQLNGEERERGRTAKELHDGVASILSATKIKVHNANVTGQEKKALFEIGELIEVAVREIRNISHNLAPEFLLREGLAWAIESFCQRVKGGELSLDFYLIGDIPKFERTVELTLYRTVQEAVTNIIKHSGATEGIVQLEGSGNILRITVEDNGIGFNKNTLSGKGLGLSGLTCRVSNVGGTIEIHSSPGRGTTINIEITSQ